jgi:catalase
MLQARRFAYGDAQRYRLGSNHTRLPVNLAAGRAPGAHVKIGRTPESQWRDRACMRGLCAVSRTLRKVTLLARRSTALPM